MNLLPINSYYKKILRVALPAIAGLSTQMVVSLVDSAMVGRLDEATYALAAMGIGVLATWALVSFFSSLATGTHVIVARRFGQGNFLECGNTLNNSLIISLLVGGIVAAIGASLAGPIAHFFASDDTVGDYASQYLFYRFLGIPFFLISVSYRGFFFGISKTKIFMISGILTNLFNVIFNYMFIYGSFGLPRMGLAGAGLGSTLATFSDVIFYLVIILLPSYRNKYQNFKHFKIDKEIIKGIYKISLPSIFSKCICINWIFKFCCNNWNYRNTRASGNSSNYINFIYFVSSSLWIWNSCSNTGWK